MVKAGDVKRKKAGEVKLPTAATASKSDQVQDLRTRLRDALQAAKHMTKPKTNEYVCCGIEDVYDKTVVFYSGTYDTLYACNYEDKGGKITLSAPVEVVRRTVYVKKGTK